MKNDIFSKLFSGFDKTFQILTSGISSEFKPENNLINSDILDIINNPEERKKLEEAVEYLQKHKAVKERKVDFSDRSIVISIG